MSGRETSRRVARERPFKVTACPERDRVVAYWSQPQVLAALAEVDVTGRLGLVGEVVGSGDLDTSPIRAAAGCRSTRSAPASSCGRRTAVACAPPLAGLPPELAPPVSSPPAPSLPPAPSSPPPQVVHHTPVRVAGESFVARATWRATAALCTHAAATAAPRGTASCARHQEKGGGNRDGCQTPSPSTASSVKLLHSKLPFLVRTVPSARQDRTTATHLLALRGAAEPQAGMGQARGWRPTPTAPPVRASAGDSGSPLSAGVPICN